MKKYRTCYMCEAPGITREHAPPSGFFPEGYKDNLVTVPSCRLHNNDNSDDVEYVRNLIAATMGETDAGRVLFEGKVTRSFKQNQVLADKTFKGKIRYEGQSGKVKVHFDLSRFDKVMDAVTNALYFRDFGERFNGQWYFIPENMTGTDEDAFAPPHPETEKAIAYLLTFEFIERPSPQPKVFTSAVHRFENGQIVYKLAFYEAFVVWAIQQYSYAGVLS